MRFDTKRKPLSTTAKFAVIEAGGGICAYCGDPATVADHIIPYCYCQNNNPENLVPSCAVCNTIAGPKFFGSMQEKRQYILAKRDTPKWCRELGKPYVKKQKEPAMSATATPIVYPTNIDETSLAAALMRINKTLYDRVRVISEQERRTVGEVMMDILTVVVRDWNGRNRPPIRAMVESGPDGSYAPKPTTRRRA